MKRKQRLPREINLREKQERSYDNFLALPYVPALSVRAVKMRNNSSFPEVLFWNEVKNGSFLGLDFDRQKLIDNYIADFYCSSLNVVIEIDGAAHEHQKEYDAARDAKMKSLGITVIRIPARAVLYDIMGVKAMLMEHPVFLRG
jgi:very-short-patch-repair endonuclease